MICFNPNSEETVQTISEWVNIVHEYGPKLVLVATKNDSYHTEDKTIGKAIESAKMKTKWLSFHSVSSVTGDGIMPMMEFIKDDFDKNSEIVEINNSNPKNSKDCC